MGVNGLRRLVWPLTTPFTVTCSVPLVDQVHVLAEMEVKGQPLTPDEAHPAGTLAAGVLGQATYWYTVN